MRGYRRKRRIGNTGSAGVLAIAIIMMLACLKETILYIIVGILVIAIVMVSVKLYRYKNTQDGAAENSTQEEKYDEESVEKKDEEVVNETVYVSKQCIMSECEKEFYLAFKEAIGEKYIIHPQINLASLIKKEGDFRYQNELFRNIDFGIFDTEYNIMLLIEINDRTHEQRERIERDQKVRDICEKAEIKLITFWTKYGINSEYIKKRLGEYLDLGAEENSQLSDIKGETK